MRIAIVGTGVAGLTAAHRLHRDHEIAVYEATPRIGGHVNTVRVDLAGETHEIDTGFIVHNDRNYPGFQALMDELGVATQPSHMSFSVSDDAGAFEYSGTPRGVFAQRSHLVDPRFLRMIRDLVLLKLQAVGLRGARDLYPQQLSGGMARRVALARALALDPPLMIYDEPLTGLDPIASGVIMDLIHRLNRTLGLTSIIVTHHVHETLPVADRAIVIADGRIAFSGTPDSLQASSDPLLRQFLEGRADGPIAFDMGAGMARTEAA